MIRGRYGHVGHHNVLPANLRCTIKLYTYDNIKSNSDKSICPLSVTLAAAAMFTLAVSVK